MDNCLFCRIIKGEIPAEKIHEDEETLVFKDINPQAPVHFLVIPKEHFPGTHMIPSSKMYLIQKIFSAVNDTVRKEGLIEEGYRLIINYGPNSGQEVPHIHVHILAGRKMKWPPG